MKRDKVLIRILGVIVLLLLGGCIYLWNHTKMPSLNVSIGVPIDENTIEFGEVIDDKDLVNNMLFGMIDSELIKKPEIAKNLPDANIKIDDVNGGICYMWAEVWIDGEDVIFSLDTKDEHDNPRYKIIYGGFKDLFIDVVNNERNKLNQNMGIEEEAEGIEIKLDGSNNIIEPNYYFGGFDFNYDELPVIHTSNVDNILKFKLSNNDLDKITVAQDYYNVGEDNSGLIEKETQILEKNKDNEFELQAKRRGNVGDEKAVYYVYLTDDREEVYIFQVDFVIEEDILEEVRKIVKEQGYSLKSETPKESDILIGDAGVFELIKEASIKGGYLETDFDSMTDDRKIIGYELNEKSKEDKYIMLCLVIDKSKVIGAYLDYGGDEVGIVPIDFK